MTFPASIRLIALGVLLATATSVSRSQITAIGGNQTMTITTALPGTEPTAVVNAAVRLRIRQQAVITKVTARTSCPGQKFGLSVVVVSTPVGTIAPAVDLNDGMIATDILTNIPVDNKNRNISIQYTASATFAQGNSTELGSDVHTITYTLVAQ